jgi:hypothetical protein
LTPLNSLRQSTARAATVAVYLAVRVASHRASLDDYAFVPSAALSNHTDHPSIFADAVTRSLVTCVTFWQTRAMPQPASKNSPPNGSGLGFETTLWSAAEKLKGNMDAAEYKHVVLGLIFLKYISDAFEEKHAALAKDKSADAEDRDEYTADNIFWVNKIARWSYLQGRAKQPTIVTERIKTGQG